MDEQRDTLGMPDIMEEYPVPGPRTLDGVLGFRVLELGESSARGEALYADRVCQRFGVVHGGAYSAFAEMLSTEATVHNVWANGMAAMGSSNDTCFLRPISAGNDPCERERPTPRTHDLGLGC